MLRAHIQAEGPFTVEIMEAKMNAIEALLLEDLELLEAYAGAPRAGRRFQIQNAYAAMKQYMQGRIPYLMSVLQ
jgi:hypothetical protein